VQCGWQDSTEGKIKLYHKEHKEHKRFIHTFVNFVVFVVKIGAMNHLTTYLIISAILFILGLLAMMTRKNGVSVLMGVELILNAAGLNFVAFSRFNGGNLNGQAAALFIMIIAAAEAAVALAIFLNLYRLQATAEVDKASLMKG